MPGSARRHEQLERQPNRALKNFLAITETRYKAPGDEVYASSPAAYLKLAALPAPNNPAPVIDALMRGDFWLTSAATATELIE